MEDVRAGSGDPAYMQGEKVAEAPARFELGKMPLLARHVS
jgi:hypothetical protein